MGITYILGEPGDEALLGLVTLEILGLVFNPFSRTLHPMRMMLMHPPPVCRSSSPSAEGRIETQQSAGLIKLSPEVSIRPDKSGLLNQLCSRCSMRMMLA